MDAVIVAAPSLPVNDSGCAAPSTMDHELMGYPSTLWFQNGLFRLFIEGCCHQQSQCKVASMKETLRFLRIPRSQEQAAHARTTAFKLEPCTRLALGSRLRMTVKTKPLYKEECQSKLRALQTLGIIESSVNLDAEYIVMRLPQSLLTRLEFPNTG